MAESGGNLVESAQFLDENTDRFFLGIGVLAPQGSNITAALAPVQARFGFGIDLEPAIRKPRLVIMVSKFDHALFPLLFQIRVGWLHADVVAIVSNHACAGEVATREGVPFHHLPVTPENKPEVEAKMLDLADTLGTDLVVLARYMQVLSDDLTQNLT